jgi:hypothetical protein
MQNLKRGHDELGHDELGLDAPRGHRIAAAFTALAAAIRGRPPGLNHAP